ncbi:MAG TPA: GspE/PulE family protein [Candidatus Saccharimonadales bacterium]|nr:GspE/PulE family protein [Candidatus Saccharimonadales bacterium]
MGIDDEQLYKLLAELDYLSVDDLNKARDLAKTEAKSLYDVLLDRDLVSDENLGKLIAYSLKLPFVTLSQSTIPEDVLKITPEQVASKFKVITFGIDDKGLKIATSNHLQPDLFPMLAKKAGQKSYRVFFATERDIESALRLYKKDLTRVFEGLLPKGAALSEVPVAKIVDTIIEYANFNKASDVHIEPTRGYSQIRFRIDGILHDVVRLPKMLHDQLVTRIKVMARLRTDEHLSAQDGRMRVLIQGKTDEDVDVRVSIVPITSGEKVVLRLLSSHNRQFGLADLGMSESNLKKIQNGFLRPYGMVLSTGPTGSGKTTTMYAILKILNTRDKNIATIEDPVEYEIAGLNQIQVNAKTGLTFANGLRSILRQDPDVMFVGEIRDEDTASIAINSAMTGHLVLSTLHTNDAVTALPRLIDMKVEPFLVASTVNVIVGQRLVRKICNTCKVSQEIVRTPTGLKGDTKLAAQIVTLNPRLVNKYFGTGNIRVYRGKGCQVCNNTGFIGRVGIFEVLVVTPKIQELISKKSNSEVIFQQAVAEGMETMMEDGLSKVQSGLTTIEEVLRVTRD